MFRAYKSITGYVDFTGRSTRSDYWLAVLANGFIVVSFYLA